MIHSKHTLLPVMIALAVLFYSCGTTEDSVVVVQDAPRTERAERETVEEEAEEFQQVNIGLIDPVTNFDPLFATNLSAQRVLTLIYDGLMTLDRNGEPVPALAREVDISEDGLEYTFTINRELFYHDSRVFPAGVGRRVHASDVKWAFERAAMRDFPPQAASLLMGVRGYENFYKEQRLIYDESRRVLSGVTGIAVIDESTVVIQLMEEDPGFLKKLASPLLLVYPREAVLNSEEGLASRPAGTGPYRLNRVENEGRILLSRFEAERGQQAEMLPRINRIDFVYNESESSLFSSFTEGDIHWIPEIGPEIMQQILEEDDAVDSAYEGTFELTENNAARSVFFYLHGGSSVDDRWLKSRMALLTPEDFMLRGDITLNVDEFELDEEAVPEEEYYISYTDDFLVRAVYTQLHNLIFRPESSLAFFDIRVPIRNTSLYSKTGDSFLHGGQGEENNYWLRIDRNILSLHHNRITGIEPGSAPWLLHIRDVQAPNREL